MKLSNTLTPTQDFSRIAHELKFLFNLMGHNVHTESWQGIDVSKRPEALMRELLNVNITLDLAGIEDLDHWRSNVGPSLPWADNHFLERVCGRPINPGVEWKNWPWANRAVDSLDENGMFNHNYMERYWPRNAHAGSSPSRTAEEWEVNEDGEADGRPWPINQGIRGEYGDLNDVVSMLHREPQTRQAWLPIFFPEDTGAEGRKPCTLGYQFIVRGNKLHTYYPLRSCDFTRHFRDDVYLTIRLALWVLEQLRARTDSQYDWRQVTLGGLQLHVTSFHMFINDYRRMIDAANA